MNDTIKDLIEVHKQTVERTPMTDILDQIKAALDEYNSVHDRVGPSIANGRFLVDARTLLPQAAAEIEVLREQLKMVLEREAATCARYDARIEGLEAEIERGYALYCPTTGDYVWKGECDD